MDVVDWLSSWSATAEEAALLGGPADANPENVTSEGVPANSEITDDVSAPSEPSVSITSALVAILRALRTSEDRKPMSLTDLQQLTGLASHVIHDAALLRTLQTNPKVLFDFSTGMYSYKPKLPCSDIHDMLRALRQRQFGELLSNLEDSYATAEADIESMSRTGGLGNMARAAGLVGRRDIPGASNSSAQPHLANVASLSRSEGGLIRLRNKDRQAGDVCLWRAPLVPEVADGAMSEFVRLSGVLKLTHGSNIAVTTADLTQELFRNDVIVLEGRAFRISSQSLSAAAQRKIRAQTRKREREEIEEKAIEIVRKLAKEDEESAMHEDVTNAEGMPVDNNLDAMQQGVDTAAHADIAASNTTVMDPPPAKKPRLSTSAGDAKKAGDPSAGKDAASKSTADDSKADADDVDDDASTESSESEVDLVDAELDFDPDAERARWGADDAGKGEGEAADRKGEEVSYPSTGIYVVSVGNDVKRTGGAFSVADTAPHRLPTGSAGYSHAFTATQLPLDRPWDGPDMTDVIAYRYGSTADLRTLWRLTATRTASDIAAATGAMQPATASDDKKAASATKSAAAPSVSSSSSSAMNPTIVGDGGIVPKLGGASALKHMWEFPKSHFELQQRMREHGLPVAQAIPGTDVVVKPMSAAERSARRRAERVRKPSKRAFQLVLGAMEGTAEGRETVRQNWRIQIMKYEEQKARAAALRAAEGKHTVGSAPASGSAIFR